MVNSNVPHYSNPVSELHRNYLFKFKLCLWFDQTRDMIAQSVVRTDYKLMNFNPLLW